MVRNLLLNLQVVKELQINIKQSPLAGLDFSLKYGSLLYELPFYIKLNDFIAEKYPGTEKSYSSFMSRVTVDSDNTFDYDIYMNHILNHKGYRFFQASFDPDEKGTILSVNKDFFWNSNYLYRLYITLHWFSCNNVLWEN